MRNDSCRKCGNKMETKDKCSTCKEPTKFVCSECLVETEEQIHLQCIFIDMHYKLLDARAA